MKMIIRSLALLMTISLLSCRGGDKDDNGKEDNRVRYKEGNQVRYNDGNTGASPQESTTSSTTYTPPDHTKTRDIDLDSLRRFPRSADKP